ncbi:TylF/MycF/NovP-related O-methyltransferase [Brevundimonas sp.]|uniref:TylF/MycF/NovP-related O-methyltransferase n=1 Tax=Brevundimonas sp. TaxID=1871086 RepID=UPI00286B0FB7|nr:TylF/MycF/NovP-related O-methyltransferase [Brevundimonas sp.]
MGLFIRNRIARALGVQVQPTDLRAVTAEDSEIVELCRPYSLASKERILAVRHAAQYVAKAGIPGAFVECGVYRGGCSMAAAYSFARAGRDDVDMYLFDTFEGMPPAGPQDVHAERGSLAADMFPADGAWDLASYEEVSENMARTGYPAERIHQVKGMVEDTIPHHAPESIALLRLDTDWYASTRHEMEHLYPRLSRGGVLIIDDYGHWAGSRQAVDEYFEAHNVHMLLARTDYTGRMGVKF